MDKDTMVIFTDARGGGHIETMRMDAAAAEALLRTWGHAPAIKRLWATETTDDHILAIEYDSILIGATITIISPKPKRIGCPMEVSNFYPEENQWMPERCDAPTNGDTFCSEHKYCPGCDLPTSHDGPHSYETPDPEILNEDTSAKCAACGYEWDEAYAGMSQSDNAHDNLCCGMAKPSDCAWKGQCVTHARYYNMED